MGEPCGCRSPRPSGFRVPAQVCREVKKAQGLHQDWDWSSGAHQGLERYGVYQGYHEGVLKGRLNREKWKGQWLEETKPFFVCNPMFRDSLINWWQYWELLLYLYIYLQLPWWLRLQRSYEPCSTGPSKMDGPWWRVLTKSGPLEKGMAKNSSILALRTPWTVWKGKKIWHWKLSSPGP